ncbi:unnamed protein product [Didymodactylos carnosus]|uniref:Mono(ADP-ribosyl)transferase n=1 Tax=Didymodactylos carnosus TaxID=1234261 RepID=A0A814JCK7_9BILA|nr:unnamed protein product [Didymodactylos carnosus]CAF1277762.1 unnamed protein product [Didymodactylos carnosus]CAF3804496.1 unnamed protein product [Didymodactylos carnosus]CAF4082784.1 unnamed protein product [Didymodactylos carnosus]
MFSLLIDNEFSCRNLSNENQVFMWFHLLIKILLRMTDDDLAKSEFIDYCKDFYANKPNLKQIDEFNQRCTPTDALVWYTKDSFVYRIINKALRLQNIYIIYKCRFLLKHIYNQITLGHLNYLEKLKTYDVDSVKVYRGQIIHKNELENIQNNPGNLISMNSFLSTTTDSNVAEMFTGYGEVDLERKVSILFEINIDLEIKKYPFIEIEHSEMQYENEVLFSINTIFEIKLIDYNEEKKFWCIHLILSTKASINEKIDQLMEHYLETMSRNVTATTLAKFLAEMGELSKAEVFLRQFQATQLHTSNNSDFLRESSIVENDLAALHYERGNYTKAIEQYHRTLEIDFRRRPCNKLSLAKVFNNLSLAYTEDGTYNKATWSFACAMLFCLECLPENYELLGEIYNNIGLWCQRTNQFQTALQNYEQSLDLLKEHVSKNHLYISTVHTNIEEFLIANHQLISTTCNNIGLCYGNLKNVEMAIQYLDKSLNIEKTYKPNNYVRIGTVYNNMGIVYSLNDDHQEALKCFCLAHEKASKQLSSTHPDIKLYLESIEQTRHFLHQN